MYQSGMIVRAPARLPLIAMDRSVRTLDKDGRLHVEVSHISKANVCPYRGREIPNGEALGLDPTQIYKLLRHPDELAKAAPTFNNLPILKRHVPVNARAPMPELVVGTTGTDCVWNDPYLDNSLAVWDGESIAAIDSDQQKELSAAYHYEAVMEPGNYQGLPYDGYMRNIVGNHVALVPEGRAGSDVIVGDSKLETATVTIKALKSRKALLAAGAAAVWIKPRLAQDAQIDLSPAFLGVTRANFKARKPAIIAAITKAAQGKIAQDATLDDIVELVDALEDVTDGEVDDDAIAEAVAADPAPVDDDPVAVDADGDKISELLAFLKGKLSDDDLAAATELVGASADDAPPEGAMDGGGKPMKTGMDAKMIERRIRGQLDAIRTAEREVRPYVGEVTMAMDSAEAVYKLALDAKGVDLTDTPPAAYRSLVRQLGATAPAPTARLGMDAASLGDFKTMFPAAVAPKRI